MSKTIWLLLLFLATGCAEVKYHQDGKSIKETEQDYFACEDKILKEHEGLRKETAKEKQTLLDECMKERGYQYKQ